MKLLHLLFFLFTFQLAFPQTKILSWNVENLGQSKSDDELTFMANVIVDHDIVAIQEVVAGYGGSQAVARLAEILNRKGTKWDYTISDPTTSSAYKTERYAFIWKTSKVKKIGSAWLEKKYHLEIDREPYYATFEKEGKSFTLVNFHAITKKKQPETEIKYFKLLPDEYPNLNLVFLGDFNCPQSHTVFNPLKKMGYFPVLIGEKTSLKKECNGDICLASEFDNIFYQGSKLKVLNKGKVLFYTQFQNLKEARKISDHLPIWMEFNLD